MKFDIDIKARGIDYTRFRSIYHSEAFNVAVAHEANLQERSLRSLERQSDGKEKRRIRMVPRVALPAAIRGLMNGHGISYDEITVFDPTTRRTTFKIESPAGDRIQVSGNARLLEESDGVRLRFEGEAQVNVLGLQGFIERYLVAEIKARYALVERMLQRFADESRERRPRA